MLTTVGFYAALNLIAWFMIFCFVRETKQLTLEEIDREFPFIDPLTKYLDRGSRKYGSLTFHRGFFHSHQAVYRLRAESVSALLHQAPRSPEEDP